MVLKKYSIKQFLLKMLAIFFLFCSAAEGVAVPDAFEDDDAYSSATYFVLNDDAQQHNFHDEGDVDWIKFVAVAGEEHTITVSNTGANCNAYIELYDTDGMTLIKRRNDGLAGESEILIRVLDEARIYYIKVGQFDEETFGEGTDYEVRVVLSGTAAGYGLVHGQVKDSCTGDGIENALVQSSNSTQVYSFPGGYYTMVHITGDFDLAASAEGYPSQTKEFSMENGAVEEVNFRLGSCSAIPCFLEDLFGSGSREVRALQRFRDEVLASHAAGCGVIDLYYNISPVLKDITDNNEVMKRALKEIINGMLPLIERLAN